MLPQSSEFAVYTECDGFVQRGVLALCRVILGRHRRMLMAAGCSEQKRGDACRACVNRPFLRKL